MHTVILKNRLDYNGSQLHHAFAYEQAQVLGPSITVFRGAADVKEHLVDLEDSLQDDFIKSADMWHFIIEVPEATITEVVALQRLFICTCIEKLQRAVSYFAQVEPLRMERCGDDIMVSCAGDIFKKLSVSIATLSRFSGLIHVGINISVGPDCPVAAIGLTDFISEVSSIGPDIAQKFADEYTDIKEATYKVISV